MSTRVRRIQTLAVASLAALALAACAPGDSAPPAAEAAATGSNRGQAYVDDKNSKANILGIALGSADHTTLVAAVQAAPLTVFAPTNEAFAALPAGTVEELLKPENKQKLAKIVTSHAAPGKFTLEHLKDGDQLYMATGHYVPVEVRDGVTYVNGARILATVDASNGVVHVVDQVFLIAAN
jgi:uncharacterized surface protein with fasciclin (FAS1) repeats